MAIQESLTPNTRPAFGGDPQIHPTELAAIEAEAIAARRAATGVPPEAAVVGLALSGGGIRSATFNLGLLQALARQDLLRRIDILSTVSGGGYAGSLFGKLLTPVGTPTDSLPAKDDEAVARATRILAAPVSPTLSWLREHGYYLVQQGGRDYFFAAALYLRNLVAVHYVLGVTLLSLFLAIDLGIEWLLGAGLWTVPGARGVAPGPLAGLALAAAVALVPLGWAYWLTQTCQSIGGGATRGGNLPLIGTLAVVFFAAVGAAREPSADPGRYLWLTLAVAGGLAVLLWQLARHPARDQASESAVRNRLDEWLASWLTIVVPLAGLALLHALGDGLVALGERAVAPGAAFAAVAAAVRYFADYLTRSGAKAKPAIRIPAQVLLTVAGVGLALLVGALWAATARRLVPHGWPQATEAVPLLALGVVLCVLTGFTRSFLNLSSLQQFYATRLRQAYLGAANPKRNPDLAAAGEKADRTDARNFDKDDDLPWSHYRPDLKGGPLHLINVTINETIGGNSAIERRDRKGLPLAVGPFGLSVGCRHHALWDDRGEPCRPGYRRIRAIAPGDHDFPVFGAPTPPTSTGGPCVELPTLSHWVGISGAAFSTGMGAHTSLGASLLMGLSNARLGYWWDSGFGMRTDPISKPFATQRYLADELLGWFRGPHRQHWYLSDGGHFENTAAYELIRRRIPLIIVSDNGCDPKYQHEDLASLVRKARIDFNAEIRFLAAADLDQRLDPPLRRLIGTLDDIAASRAHAALAKVCYLGSDGRSDGTPASLLLLVKPGLIGDESADLREYHAQHPDFPQQTTGDQMFDEAQWESYRKLGQHIGTQLFTPYPGTRWQPGSLTLPADWDAASPD